MAATDILTNLLGTLNGLRPADAAPVARTAQQGEQSDDWSQSRGHRAPGAEDDTE